MQKFVLKEKISPSIKMSLWFAGADNVNTNRCVVRSSCKMRVDSPSVTQHLESGSLLPASASPATGKKHVPMPFGESRDVIAGNAAPPPLFASPQRTPGRRATSVGKMLGFSPSPYTLTSPSQSVASPVTRGSGVRIVNDSPAALSTFSFFSSTNDEATRFAPPPVSPAPYAKENNNQPAVPYGSMRRHVPCPQKALATDGDAFVLRRSRTPPASARCQRTTEEGFAVLLASDMRSKANPQLVVAGRNGKGSCQSRLREAEAQRDAQAAMKEEAVRARAEKALAAERDRVEAQLALSEKLIRYRCRTPPNSARPLNSAVPFAVNLSVPHASANVGRTSARNPAPHRRWE